MNKTANAIATAIEEAYKPSDAIVKLINLANNDLYNGPIDSFEKVEGWPGFSKACAAISDALDNLWPGSLYFDEDCGALMEKEPQGEYLNGETMEPCDSDDDGAEYFEPSPYYEIERSEFMRAVVGHELAGYL